MASLTGKRHRVLFPLISLIAIALLLLWQVRVLIRDSEWVDRADQVIALVNRIERHVVDLETGVRGYALTGDPVFLEPYSRSLEALPQDFQTFKQMSAEDRVQRTRMEAVQDLVNRWNRFADEVISLRRSGRDPIPLLKTGRGKTLIDSIRVRMSEIIDAEAVDRHHHAVAARAEASWVFGSSVVAFILFGLYLSRSLTLRLRWENVLRLSEEQLNAFFTDSPAGMLLLDHELRYLKVNQFLADINGLSIEEHLGRTVSEVLPKLAPIVMPIFEKILKSGESVLNTQVSGETRREPGKTRNWMVSYFPIKNPAGGIGYIGGVVVEVTELRKVEEAIRESEQRFRQLAENIPEVFWLLDFSEKKIAYVSPAFERIWGLPQEALYRNPMLWSELIAEEERGRVEEAFRNFEQNNGYEMTYRIRRPDGGIRWIHDRGFLIRDQQGQPIRGAGIANDITERKNTEEFLRKQEMELQNALRSRDEFLSIASHDLKTPLTALALQLDLLKRALRSGMSPEMIDGIMNRTRGQVDRLTELLNDLLDLTRIRVGKLSLNPTEVDLSAAVREVVDHLSAEIASKGIEVRLHADEAVIGKWDPLRVSQMVTNLVSNAIKYGKDQPVDLWVEKDQGKGLAMLRVVDRGMGIAPQFQRKIFERFERASDVGGIKGLGLGLYITRQIAEAHHGRIRVLSEEGKGSTFILELPLEIGFPTAKAGTEAA